MRRIRTEVCVKHLLSLVAAATVLPWVTSAADWQIGDLMVVRVGDGTTTLANTAGPISVLEVSQAGSLVQTIPVPSVSGGLQVSGTATSEGQLLLNAGGQSLTLAGYVPPFTGSGSLSGRTSTQAPRGYVTVDSHGTVSSTTTLSGAYSGQISGRGLPPARPLGLQAAELPRAAVSPIITVRVFPRFRE